jgi:methionyl-tRNA synthetase
MNLEGDKMSTSRNWKLDMQDYIDDFVKKENGGTQLVDSLRYYLTMIAPETKDSEFTWKGFQDANNSELASIFGNFVNRTFVLMHKLCKGKVPPLHAEAMDAVDQAIIRDIENAKGKVEGLLEQYKFREALFEVIDLSRKGNKYMQEKEPWKKVEGNQEDQKSIDNCIHLCLQLTANLAILINPFLPFTAKKMLHLMKVVDKLLDWDNAGKLKLLSVGYSLRPPELLFRKIEDEEVKAQVQKLQAAKARQLAEAAQNEAGIATAGAASAETPPKSPIVYEDFAKLELKVGTILAAEKVVKADKLLKLNIDLGTEQRTIVSGIAGHFKPEEIIGKQVVVVANLAPRKMRGIESNGMILMAEDKDGKLYFVSPENKITPGSGVS